MADASVVICSFSKLLLEACQFQALHWCLEYKGEQNANPISSVTIAKAHCHAYWVPCTVLSTYTSCNIQGITEVEVIAVILR